VSAGAGLTFLEQINQGNAPDKSSLGRSPASGSAFSPDKHSLSKHSFQNREQEGTNPGRSRDFFADPGRSRVGQGMAEDQMFDDLENMLANQGLPTTSKA